MKDKNTVSNDYFELKAVAKKMGVTVSTVMFAKEITGSNLRSKIEKWISDNELFKLNDRKVLKIIENELKRRNEPPSHP